MHGCRAFRNGGFHISDSCATAWIMQIAAGFFGIILINTFAYYSDE